MRAIHFYLLQDTAYFGSDILKQLISQRRYPGRVWHITALFDSWPRKPLNQVRIIRPKTKNLLMYVIGSK